VTGSRGTKTIVSPTLTVESATAAVTAAGEAIDRADPLEALLRLCVNYRPHSARAEQVEAGVITGVRGEMVFVRYWGERTSKATTPECLTWAYPQGRQ
jgi:hypothetical protein